MNEEALANWGTVAPKTNNVARPEGYQSPPPSAEGKNILSRRVKGQICLQFDKEQFCDFIGHEDIWGSEDRAWHYVKVNG